jgi:CIC family chloride channel protein
MKSEPSLLRDFTVDKRVFLISGVAVLIGCGATVLAVVLLRLIGLSTNLFYYHRFNTALVSPAGSPLGYWMVFVPVIGGMLVGLMARYGSDKIRGHGIPEAIEAILLHRARVDPKIAVLKPISAAIAIGSGGPFGAEGPIIMTGGAFGSLIAQWIHLTDAERTTLLVAGAAAGMSATFATPLAGSRGSGECRCRFSKNAMAGIRSALSHDDHAFRAQPGDLPRSSSSGSNRWLSFGSDEPDDVRI